jgi:ubiquinone/menaquinone biosynthesis C-methylase UbiE
MRDVARSNRYFGGGRALRRAITPLFRELAPTTNGTLTVLDVGAGTGDLEAVLRRAAKDADARVSITAVDLSTALLATHRARFDASVSADAARLPFADRSIDVVVCSQLLHHFADGHARVVIAELHRVAQRGVVISDLRRSWLAAGGFWIASLALGFHPITRHDGVVSVLRGFTIAELRELTRSVTGVTPTMRRGVFWRVSATWRPSGR